MRLNIIPLPYYYTGINYSTKEFIHSRNLKPNQKLIHYKSRKTLHLMIAGKLLYLTRNVGNYPTKLKSQRKPAWEPVLKRPTGGAASFLNCPQASALEGKHFVWGG